MPDDDRAEAADRRRGQAQIELVASIPLLLAAGAVMLQLFAVGYARSLADGAAEAGAIAHAAGAEAEDAALASLPGWARRRAVVETSGGRVVVAVDPPSLLPVLGGGPAVEARAWARGPSDGGPR